jgi:hypothetical protein
MILNLSFALSYCVAPMVPLEASLSVPEINNVLNRLGYKKEQGPEKFETVKNSFEQLRRRTFANKFKLMLEQLGIDYSNVQLKPNKIVPIRNDITHRGYLGGITDEIELNKAI